MQIFELEFSLLHQQANDLSSEINQLDQKHQAANKVALQFAQQLEALRSTHHATLLKLRDLEQHRCGSYMWENIGDGG